MAENVGANALHRRPIGAEPALRAQQQAAHLSGRICVRDQVNGDLGLLYVGIEPDDTDGQSVELPYEQTSVGRRQYRVEPLLVTLPIDDVGGPRYGSNRGMIAPLEHIARVIRPHHSNVHTGAAETGSHPLYASSVDGVHAPAGNVVPQRRI